jgi:hypothetical protein
MMDDQGDATASNTGRVLIRRPMTAFTEQAAERERLAIEVSSVANGTSRTRFKVLWQPGHQGSVELSCTAVELVHLVDVGSQNTRLRTSSANAAGPPLLGGPEEATALANILVQGRSPGAMPPSLDAARETVVRNVAPKRFESR